MNRFWKGFLTILLALVIAGCGSGGTTGNGNTVFISSSIKTGTPLIAFANFSSNGQFTASQLSFTIKSTPYTTTGTVPKSDVLINKVFFNYTPVTVGAPAFVPVVASKDYGVPITPGGSADISNVSIISALDMAKIQSLAPTTGGTFQYKLDATFAGTEVNTGASLSTVTSASVFVVVPASGP